MAGIPGKPRNQSGGGQKESVQALVKVEKLTAIAFALPVAALVGWVVGGLLDRWLHQHWIWIVGLVVGVIAGFVQVFRMISAPGTLAATSYDFSANRGPGFDRKEDEKE